MKHKMPKLLFLDGMPVRRCMPPGGPPGSHSESRRRLASRCLLLGTVTRSQFGSLYAVARFYYMRLDLDALRLFPLAPVSYHSSL